MSDRPQWMKEAEAEINSRPRLVTPLVQIAMEIIAEHYAAEDARVQELGTATREFADIAGATKVETVMARQRVYKALKAWEK